jgi:hypothetical protein
MTLPTNVASLVCQVLGDSYEATDAQRLIGTSENWARSLSGAQLKRTIEVLNVW